jgi:hypothetical protein
MATLRAALGLAAAALLAACSFSHSSGSFSDSSESSSDSSRSSASDGTQFANDVVEYTEAYVEAGGGSESFLSGVGDLANERGITDWESEPAVWENIGRGLGKSDASQAQIAAYANAWTGGDRTRIAAIQKGVDDER